MSLTDTGASNPDFLPQMFWVEVIPGFEDCRFKISSSKNTVAQVDIFTAHPQNKPEQDLTPANLMFSNESGLPMLGSSFDVTLRALKQATMYRFRISTYDTSNGEAEAFGTFTTKSRKATAQIHQVFIWKAGDPSGTGEVFMQFGLFRMETTGWSPGTGKSDKIGSVTWGYGDVTDGTAIHGIEFSDSGTVAGENVPDFLRVVFYAKDKDDDVWVHFKDSGGEFMCPGSEGCDADGQPIAPAQGYDEGEWVRLVQNFPHVPRAPGSYNFPFTLTSTWGVECDVAGHVTVEVTQGPNPTVFNQREGS